MLLTYLGNMGRIQLDILNTQRQPFTPKVVRKLIRRYGPFRNWLFGLLFNGFIDYRKPPLSIEFPFES
jgi:hypothetical protein